MLVLGLARLPRRTCLPRPGWIARPFPGLVIIQCVLTLTAKTDRQMICLEFITLTTCIHQIPRFGRTTLSLGDNMIARICLTSAVVTDPRFVPDNKSHALSSHIDETKIQKTNTQIATRIKNSSPSITHS
jgi:hypothetical protein